ncbi:MAG TPA: hypothetical protein VH234_01880 [Candidatus Saccharimonadales bacterium]|nr:hypothetical protein [Candidatus Saccharimonadales bacterium]
MFSFVDQEFGTVGVSGFKPLAVIGVRPSCTFMASSLSADNAMT